MSSNWMKESGLILEVVVFLRDWLYAHQQNAVKAKHKIKENCKDAIFGDDDIKQEFSHIFLWWH